MIREELKPCPNTMCKGQELDIGMSGDTGRHWVWCWNCGLRGPQEATAEMARDAWNSMPREDDRRIPAPRRWTEKDETPPDGLYITAMTTGGAVVELRKGEAVFNSPAITEEAKRLRRDLWKLLDSAAAKQLYGPIEAANPLKNPTQKYFLCPEVRDEGAVEANSAEEAEKYLNCCERCKEECGCDGPIEAAGGAE